MNIDRCSRADFAQILEEIEDFWGSDRTRHLHQPSLVEEFGDTAFVVREGARVAGYLFAYFAQGRPYLYVHLSAVRADRQGHGIGTALYAHAEAVARAAGRTALRAITTPTNRASIAFHVARGFTLEGDHVVDGVRCVEDYAGPGQDRAVMTKMLA